MIKINLPTDLKVRQGVMLCHVLAILPPSPCYHMYIPNLSGNMNGKIKVLLSGCVVESQKCAFPFLVPNSSSLHYACQVSVFSIHVFT